MLVALEFFDAQNNSLLKVGYDKENVNYPYVDVVLEDGERIVGFKSGSRGKTNATHFDF
jgi:hypothetical protein